eukprot:1002203-Amorphochlora_amoeboformis.AAC.1
MHAHTQRERERGERERGEEERERERGERRDIWRRGKGEGKRAFLIDFGDEFREFYIAIAMLTIVLLSDVRVVQFLGTALLVYFIHLAIPEATVLHVLMYGRKDL